MKIRICNSSDLTQINALIAHLHPKWFDNNALKNIPIDVQLGKTYIASINNKLVGFITLSSLEGTVWINWMAVSIRNQGKGIGKSLLNYAIGELKEIGVNDLRVNTVVQQSPQDGSYDKTVQFYLSNGFEIISREKAVKTGKFTYQRGIMRKSIV